MWQMCQQSWKSWSSRFFSTLYHVQWNQIILLRLYACIVFFSFCCPTRKAVLSLEKYYLSINWQLYSDDGLFFLPPNLRYFRSLEYRFDQLYFYWVYMPQSSSVHQICVYRMSSANLFSTGVRFFFPFTYERSFCIVVGAKNIFQ